MLEFKFGTPAPYKLSRPVDAVVYNEIAYFRRDHTRIIEKYDSRTQTWSTFPDCPMQDTSLAILPRSDKEYILHTVGGYLKDRHAVGDLYCLSMRPTADRSGTEYYWSMSSFPPMTEPRKQVTTFCDREYKYLITAGGRGKHGPTKTVEVLNIETSIWSTIASLPQVVFRASGCISGGYLYIAGGRIYDQACNEIEVKSVFRAPLSRLIQSEVGTIKNVFEHITDLPYERSACTAFHDRVFAIGGTKHSNIELKAVPTNQVFTYYPEEDLWKLVPNSLSKSRCCCFAVSFTQPKPQLMVVGGYTTKHDEDCTDSTEIAELD